MTGQTNSPINTNPIPPELQAYLPEAHKAEESALDAELPVIGYEIVQAAQDYDSAITELGKTTADEAEKENEFWGKYPEAGIQDAETFNHHDAVTIPRIIGEELIAAEAYPREVAKVGEDLPQGQRLDDSMLAAEIEHYLDNPALNEALLQNSGPPKQSNTEGIQDSTDNAVRESEHHDTGQSYGSETGFRDTIDAKLSGQHTDDTLPPRLTLSQEAEMHRKANAAREGNISGIEAARIRGNFTRLAITANLTSEQAEQRWLSLASQNPGLAKTTDGNIPKLIRNSDGHVTGVEFIKPDEDDQ